MKFLSDIFKNIKTTELFKLILRNKKKALLVLLVIVTAVTATGTVVFAFDRNDNKNSNSEAENDSASLSQTVNSQEGNSEASSILETSSTVDSSSNIDSSVAVSSAVKTESVVSTVKKENTASVVKKPTATVIGTDYKFNTNVDIENNVFLDSLVYTGYNLAKHRADGNMWVYILASKKRGLGYLSKIGYAGGSSGYETLNGKPNIAAFERGGLVCASYVTYVYFNYLPNVAGIDTSSLTRPVRSYSAHDWYIAAKDWIKKGYSKSISFKASKTSAGFINFKPSEEIPIGSIMVFQDARSRTDHGSHVAVYAGYKNGYNWVFHVGNENGPEFCAVERMHFGPDPQWPLMVISTPSNIRMSALLDISVKDNEGNAVKGVGLKLKRTATSKETLLTATDAGGKCSRDNLDYGDYQLIVTVPNGYTLNDNVIPIKLNTLNNSKNTVNVLINKIPPVVVAPPSASSSTAESSSTDNTSGITSNVASGGSTSSASSTVSSNASDTVTENTSSNVSDAVTDNSSNTATSNTTEASSTESTTIESGLASNSSDANSTVSDIVSDMSSN